MIVGVIFKMVAPGKIPWFIALTHKKVKLNEQTCMEAHTFAATPILIAGALFFALGIVSIVLPTASIFSQKAALILYISSGIFLRLLVVKQLNKKFDENGNRK